MEVRAAEAEAAEEEDVVEGLEEEAVREGTAATPFASCRLEEKDEKEPRRGGGGGGGVSTRARSNLACSVLPLMRGGRRVCGEAL